MAGFGDRAGMRKADNSIIASANDDMPGLRGMKRPNALHPSLMKPAERRADAQEPSRTRSPDGIAGALERLFKPRAKHGAANGPRGH